jgi:dipeptidyl aminopeptidase/acylaminoacyl peptidase
MNKLFSSNPGGNRMYFKKISRVCLFLLSAAVVFSLAADKRPLEYTDIMKFREIHNAVISSDGQWVAFAAEPGRGDGEAVIRNRVDDRHFRIERGSRPVFTKDALWVAVTVKPPAAEIEAGEKSKTGMALLNLASGDIREYDQVIRFSFSDDSKWLAFQKHKKEDNEKKEAKTETAEAEIEPGTNLMLINLETGEEIQIPFVKEFGFDATSRFLAYSTATPDGEDNGLSYVELSGQGWARKIIEQKEQAEYAQLTWTENDSLLAFVTSVKEGEAGALPRIAIRIWDADKDRIREAVNQSQAPQGWVLPAANSLEWSSGGDRLYFGFQPQEIAEAAQKKPSEKDSGEEETADLFDVDGILNKRGVDVWHWDDPYIIPHQKEMWPRVKEQTYTAVFHSGSGRIVPLADRDMPQIRIQEGADKALGYLDAPYRKMVTWYGRLSDLYMVDIKDGSRTKVVSRLEHQASLSPEGRYVVYFKDKHWHLFDSRSDKTVNLTESLPVPFYDEDHDYPSPVPGYGTAGWLENDEAVLIYDKYDVWKFPVRGGSPVCLTGKYGRDNLYTFRIQPLDPDKEAFSSSQRLLLSAYHNHDKHWGFYTARTDGSTAEPLLEEEKKFNFLAKAEDADVLLYTRESYQEFPDLWVSGLDFSQPEKITQVNPQIEEFAWGSAELVEWESVDGIPLQGVLIKPGNYEEGKQYPVVVYYYRFFSQRLHEFNQVVINHRPCFPFYASNGYAVFLPDIRFDVGLPGYAATKCLVPGVQKIVDMGIADPDAIGLHGHSWSGYQTAHVITQTDIFTCAVAGAPVSNMTSAYSGIRWGSGLARQFQYEQSQSRIGGSLWEKRELYIENSPVFFADRIQTPLLIIFGDEDGAVPWYQGIELYLAMRRLQKDCVFLQYRGEPHHPQKYPNKLDWFKKMKEYFDHYLKDQPGPEWITKGVPYRGK